MPPNGNTKPNARPWGPIREIDADEMPSATGKWWNLYQEISLRLEQTPERLALAVPFPHGDGIRGAHRALSQMFNKRKGKGVVVFVAGVDRDGVPTLYARRGPNWKK